MVQMPRGKSRALFAGGEGGKEDGRSRGRGTVWRSASSKAPRRVVSSPPLQEGATLLKGPLTDAAAAAAAAVAAALPGEKDGVGGGRDVGEYAPGLGESESMPVLLPHTASGGSGPGGGAAITAATAATSVTATTGTTAATAATAATAGTAATGVGGVVSVGRGGEKNAPLLVVKRDGGTGPLAKSSRELFALDDAGGLKRILEGGPMRRPSQVNSVRSYRALYRLFRGVNRLCDVVCDACIHTREIPPNISRLVLSFFFNL